MISISSLLGQTNPFEDTIQQLVLLEELDKISLQADQSQLTNKKSAITTVGTRLSTLSTTLKSFRDSIDDQISPQKGTPSNDDFLSVISTSDINKGGIFSFSVSQLAKQDIVLSDVTASTGTTLSASGTGSFDITIGSGDPVTITVDTTGLDDQGVLQAIASEVEAQVGESISANAFNVDSDNTQLSFKALTSGSDNAITISNQTGDFSTMNLTNQFAANELDAQFSIDNVNFTRSSNIVDDAIDGLSFELKQVTTGTEQLTLELDTDAAVANIESFISNFNDVNSYIRSQTNIDTVNGNNGILSGERTIRNLATDMRLLALEQIPSMSGQAISSLGDIGITLAQDGTMSISDKTKLEESLKTNSSLVNQLFTKSDGLSEKLISKIDQFITGDDNVIDTFETGLDTRIDRLDDRIAREDQRLADYEEQLRAEFAALDLIITNGEFQFNQVLQFQNQLLAAQASTGFGF